MSHGCAAEIAKAVDEWLTGLRVEIKRLDGQPATCRVWANDLLRFDGVEVQP